ncbi:MAG: NAD(P)-dependent oxidoreductase [Cyclobacteriaceae bacterium]
MNILITGASGFIGGFIVEEALEKDMTVFAAVRKTSNKQYLTNPRINFVEINFGDKENLTQQLVQFRKDQGEIDYVIHNAGVTKVLSPSEYERVNFQFTQNFVEAIKESGHSLTKFVYISSMAASGPGKPNTDIPIKTTDTNSPVTEYGRSKLRTEEYLQSTENFPYIVLRPPAVFGPRDADMFSFFQLIKNKLELYIGTHTQYLSFIYVKDLAAAIIHAALSSVREKTYFISDNKSYTNLIFSSVIKHRMEKKTFVIKLPLFLVKIVAFISENVGKLTKTPSPLNVDKINELRCSNWLCDSSEFYKETGFETQYSLEQGIQETIDWYKKENWL